jgi:multiple sugar transport system permease protein
MSLLQIREARVGYIFILPWIIGLLAFTVGPILFSLYTSFTEYNIAQPPKWIGLQNYITALAADMLVPKSFMNTLWYACVNVPIVTVGGLLVACALNTKIPGMRFFRTVYYIPSVLVGIGVYFLWMLLLHPTNGLVNWAVGLLGVKGPAWLSSPQWTKPAVVLMNVWGFGAQMLLYLARLQSIPEDLYEAAELDGAGGGGKFLKITIPMLSPIIFYNLTLSIIGNLQVFQEGYVLSGDGTGQPANSLLFFNLHLWRQAFYYFRMGYASALSWLLFIVIMALTAVNVLVSKHWVFYEGGGPND